ncbi:MAG: sodium:solute symporter family protein [Bacillota bacterium]
MLHFVALIGYLVGMSLVASYYSKFIKTEEDFLLAGRRLGAVVLAGTMMATWMGSGTVVGGTNSLGYQYGPWVAVIFGIASPIGILLLVFLSKRIKAMQARSVPDVFELAYGPAARAIVSVIVMIAYLAITSYQFTGTGFVLNAILGIPTSVATLISAVAITAMTVTGGLVSVAYTDFISAVLMLTGLLLGVPAAIIRAGGWSSIAAKLPPQNLRLGGITWLKILGYFLPTFLLVIGDQNMYQRLFAAKDATHARMGSIGWFIGVALVMPLVAFGATASRALHPNIPAGQALITLAVKDMPAVLGMLCIIAISAFIVTTGDSFLLTCSTNLGWDLYFRYINPKASERQRLVFYRAAVIVLAAIAYVIVQFFPTVLAVQMYAYTMYGAAVTPPLLAAVIWPGTTKAAGISSMLVGAVTTLTWEIMKKPFGIDTVLVAAPLSVAVLVIVNLLTRGKKVPSQVSKAV